MLRQDSTWWRAGFTRDWWRGLSLDERYMVLETLTPQEAEEWFLDWRVWARDKQLTPEPLLKWDDGKIVPWRIWLLVCGRGFGKTRTAVEAINEDIKLGNARRIAIVGQGENDIRRVMIEGKSGFINTAPQGLRPKWTPSASGGLLEWPNGALGFVHSAEDPEALRGPEYDRAWFDEPMACKAKQREETMSNLRFGLRIETNGTQPRLIITTTPKKHAWMRKMLADAKNPKKRIAFTRGSTYENEDNLAASFIDGIKEDFEDTRLGKQEIYGELIGDEEGALWTEEILEKFRLGLIDPVEMAERCDKVVVGVDPNIKPDETAHEAGVVVVGKIGKQRYILADRSCKGGPAKWAQAAVLAFDEFQADEIVAEVNQGGEMVRSMCYHAADEEGIAVKVIAVHATRGKQRRAEPVSMVYERGLAHHVGDASKFTKLESQMTNLHDGLDPTGEDFDRLDAMVWGMTRLGLKKRAIRGGGGGGRAPMMGSFAEFGGENAATQ